MSIDDRALDPARWDPILADIMDGMVAQTAFLGLGDLVNNYTLISKSVGSKSHWLHGGACRRANGLPRACSLRCQTLDPSDGDAM